MHTYNLNNSDFLSIAQILVLLENDISAVRPFLVHLQHNSNLLRDYLIKILKNANKPFPPKTAIFVLKLFLGWSWHICQNRNLLFSNCDWISQKSTIRFLYRGHELFSDRDRGTWFVVCTYLGSAIINYNRKQVFF